MLRGVLHVPTANRLKIEVETLSEAFKLEEQFAKKAYIRYSAACWSKFLLCVLFGLTSVQPYRYTFPVYRWSTAHAHRGVGVMCQLTYLRTNFWRSFTLLWPSLHPWFGTFDRKATIMTRGKRQSRHAEGRLLVLKFTWSSNFRCLKDTSVSKSSQN